MRLTLAALLLLAACGRTELATPRPSAGRNAPVRAELSAREDGELTHLTLSLVRTIAWAAPVTVDLDLPAGVSLTRGERHRTLAGNRAAGRDALGFTVRGRPHRGDALRVIVAARGPGYGFHATLPYRFGAPPDEVVAPAPSGAAVRALGHALGPAVDAR